ncbi:MAG TPA: neutral/alkaline non-lysosomal ceramidase N-terminal domain-containing protein [Anaeromyxobacter sp.]|nr:neutral/alkaline non-lysosomal ceramidase N-terminal domain-containing protein [Anaeromyxobacter sp.]
MKYLPGRGVLRALLAVVLVAAAALGAASLPWHADRAPVPPRLVRAAAGSGPLEAGVAEAPFDLPAGVPIAGFARLAYGSEGSRDPVGARAVVLSAQGCRVALASAEILLVPEALEEAVAARVTDLGLAGIVLGATHTHAGPGGYWEHPIGERIATGPYDPRVRDAVAGAIADAIRKAALALAPARASVAAGSAEDLARSRSAADGAPEEARLTVVRVDRPDGAPVAEIAIFAAHPTILDRSNRRLSGDWPGRFLAEATRGTRLFFQGALGDQSVESSGATPEAFGAALSARVDALRGSPPDLAPALAYAEVEVGLPSPDPGGAPAWLRRAARNLAHGSVPATAHVEAVRIGRAVLVAVPAEPVAAVAAAWRRALPPGADLVSLAGGYVGYVETPEHRTARTGESVRTYYGPELATRLGAAAKLAADAVTGPVAAKAR